MTFALGKDEEFVMRALQQAAPNALRMALYQATGDKELIEMQPETQSFWGGAFKYAALTPEDSEIVQAKAREFLRSATGQAGPLPTDDTLLSMMDSYGTKPLSDVLHRMGREAIALDEFPRGVEWSNGEAPARRKDFHVAVIGAGVGGIAVAIQLQRLGIPYTLYDRNSGIGGTWQTNDYPDARVDVASHHYQYSFVKGYPWKHYFATQGEMKTYLEYVAEQFGILPRIKLDSSVTAAKWDAATSTWKLTVNDNTDGSEAQVAANAVISAAGLFNAPNIPNIPGLDDFQGKMFHTTRWDHDYDIKDKKVGLIGTGSSGSQLMPRIAPDVERLTIFQRNASWVTPIEGYSAPVSEEAQWLFAQMPYYWNWYCFGIFHMMFDDIEGLQTYDPEWQQAGGLISERNDQLREFNIGYIASKMKDKPELIDKLTPKFPPFAQRPVVDNGWFDALNRPNVDLVTEGIERITADGVLTTDGTEHSLDLIVLGTGFKTERYLWPINYEGIGGITIEEAWKKDGARAYLGLTVPDFPNLFVLYGPNAQCRTGGLFTWLEVWGRYAVKSVVKLIESGKHSMNCRRDIFDDYNARMDEEHKRCVWTAEGQKSYFLNEHGRPGVLLPWNPVEYFDWVYEPDLADFEVQ